MESISCAENVKRRRPCKWDQLGKEKLTVRAHTENRAALGLFDQRLTLASAMRRQAQGWKSGFFRAAKS
jgi:hypothetical protein